MSTPTYSRSRGLKNIRPQIPYHLQIRAGQWHKICTLSSLTSPDSQQSYRTMCSRINMWALGSVWPANTPTATLSVNLLCRRSLSVLCRGWLISMLYWQHPWQTTHPVRCSWWPLFPAAKVTQATWPTASLLAPSLANPFPLLPAWCYVTIDKLHSSVHTDHRQGLV